jgi:hypothetical protein
LRYGCGPPGQRPSIGNLTLLWLSLGEGSDPLAGPDQGLVNDPGQLVSAGEAGRVSASAGPAHRWKVTELLAAARVR